MVAREPQTQWPPTFRKVLVASVTSQRADFPEFQHTLFKKRREQKKEKDGRVSVGGGSLIRF